MLVSLRTSRVFIVCYLLIETTLEVFFHAADCHSVLRPLRSAHVGYHGTQVDLNHLPIKEQF